jgi:hypothetical protein
MIFIKKYQNWFLAYQFYYFKPFLLPESIRGRTVSDLGIEGETLLVSFTVVWSLSVMVVSEALLQERRMPVNPINSSFFMLLFNFLCKFFAIDELTLFVNVKSFFSPR